MPDVMRGLPGMNARVAGRPPRCAGARSVGAVPHRPRLRAQAAGSGMLQVHRGASSARPIVRRRAPDRGVCRNGGGLRHLSAASHLPTARSCVECAARRRAIRRATGRAMRSLPLRALQRPSQPSRPRSPRPTCTAGPLPRRNRPRRSTRRGIPRDANERQDPGSASLAMTCTHSGSTGISRRVRNANSCGSGRSSSASNACCSAIGAQG